MLEELTDTPVELGISSEWGYGDATSQQETTLHLYQSIW